MIVPKKLFLATIAAATSVANGAELTGYLYDVLCVDLSANPNGGPPDGSDAFLRPQDHTGECLLLDVCVESGFSLMSADTDADGKHRVVADFTDDASQVAVVDYIKVSDMILGVGIHFLLGECASLSTIISHIFFMMVHQTGRQWREEG